MLLKNGVSFRIRYEPKMNQYSAWYKGAPQKTGGFFIRDEMGAGINQKEIEKIKKGISKIEPFKLANKILKDLPIKKVLRIINYRTSLFLEKNGQRAEIDLDDLIFQKGKSRKRGCEIELENKSASSANFKKLVSHLKKKFNLTPWRLSKYARGIK